MQTRPVYQARKQLVGRTPCYKNKWKTSWQHSIKHVFKYYIKHEKVCSITSNTEQELANFKVFKIAIKQCFDYRTYFPKHSDLTTMSEWTIFIGSCNQHLVVISVRGIVSGKQITAVAANGALVLQLSWHVRKLRLITPGLGSWISNKFEKDTIGDTNA